jgi:hypothetical protein
MVQCWLRRVSQNRLSRKEFVRHNSPANVLEEKSGLLSQAELSPYHRIATLRP